MDLSSPITTLPGIGSIMAKKLEKLGIKSVFDLLYHIPFRYEDRSKISSISQIQPGETVTIIGKIESIKNDFTKGRKFIQKAIVSDDSGSIDVIWFNQTYLTRTLKAGDSVTLYGKVEFFGPKKTLVSPEYEIGNNLIHMGRIVPIYPETAGVSSKWLRAKIFPILTTLTDFSPFDIQSLKNIHFPQSLDQTESARRRLAKDELLLLQLSALIHRQSWQKTRLSHIFSVPYPQIRQFIANLPFTLTLSQNKTVDEILTDLSTPNPMNRLLEGDVGSGKTIVAAIAAYAAHLNNFQTLILAPTQILAHQHYQTLKSLIDPFGISVGLITGNSKLDAKRYTLDAIFVGTHALLSKKFDSVGLIIIDEQHRFGVAQRALAASKGESPHILTMTATPIPRTVALTLYGDLDLSVLTDLPSGRIPVKTWVIPEHKRSAAYEWIKSQKTQTFIVCPFIEESETLKSVKAASAEFAKLAQIFPHLKLGLLHGKLKAKEKEEVIHKFRAGESDILVSTPVVEVGIDIPDATVMIIEAAERFGLAQLHQLRGRVGRSDQQSYCLLFSNSDTDRLKAMETHHSGLELAEIDLKLRGPGNIYGTTQHGLPRFKVASYQDFDLINEVKAEAAKILPDLKKYPLLRSLLQEAKMQEVQPN
ncbi:MAG: ATP-dependent DNA helicase RecG [Microgenomates group bacterium Gr01-1014_16]|nr:MAG: ATP-dependent DNA helicase RecG [Microgenomates group bacterium Gr01-1014_16]